MSSSALSMGATSSFPGDDFNDQINRIEPQSPRLKDIINDFLKLPEYGDQIVMRNDNVIIEDYYTYYAIPSKKSATHFQGIIRLPESNYFIISGAEARNENAQIFIGKIRSYLKRSAHVNKPAVKPGPMGSNIIDSSSPPISDHLIDVFRFADVGYFHAGGIDFEGSIVSVPLENRDDKSKIKFLNVANPEYPELLPFEIKRSKKVGKAGAAGIVRLHNKKYLCAVWTDSDTKSTGLQPRLDLYLSNSSSILNGFKTKPEITITWDQIINHPDEMLPFQNLQLFLDTKYRLFVLGTSLPDETTPIIGNSYNEAYLMQLKYKNSAGNLALKNAQLAVLHCKKFSKLKYNYNFRAGACFTYSEDRKLVLYGIGHWRHGPSNDYISIGEFWHPLEGDSRFINNIDQAWIELYEEENFGIKTSGNGSGISSQKKRCLRLYGKMVSNFPNYKNIKVQSRKNHKGFQKRISSITGILPPGISYELFSKVNFKGKSMTIHGNGRYFEHKNLLKEKMNNKIQSSKIIIK